MMTPAPSQPSTRRTRGPRYELTVNGQPVPAVSQYRDTLLDDAKQVALQGRPGTVARVTDTRKGTWWEYERGSGHQFFSRAGVNA
jgi:hypothetical protein